MANQEQDGFPINPNEYPKSTTEWLFYFLPQIAVFVFVTVCVIALVRFGGFVKYFAYLIPVVWVTIRSIQNTLRRARCS